MQQTVAQNVTKKRQISLLQGKLCSRKVGIRMAVVMAQHLLNIALTGKSTLYKLRSNQI